MSARELKELKSELYTYVRNRFPFLPNSAIEKVITTINNYGLNGDLSEKEIIEKGIERWEKRYKENAKLIDSCCEKLGEIIGVRGCSDRVKYYATIMVDNAIRGVPTYCDIRKSKDKIYLYNSGPYRATIKGGKLEIEKGKKMESFCVLYGAQRVTKEFYKVNRPLPMLCEIANTIQEKFNEKITGKKIKINKKRRISPDGFVSCVEEIILKE